MNSLKIVSCLIILLSLTCSCGSNLFEGLAKDAEKTEELNNLLENAVSEEDYKSIRNKSDEIINSATASAQEKSQANLTKAEAILGQNNVTPTDIFADLAKAASDSSAGNQSNPLDALSNIGISNTELIESSKAISAATEEDMTDDQQLLKGVVNTMIIVNTIDKVIDVDANGDMKRKDENTSYSKILDEIVYPDGKGEGKKSIFEYSTEASNGFTKSKSLSTDQEKQINETKTASENLNKLYEATNNGTPFTLNGKTYNSSSTDADIQKGLEDIFKDMNQ